MVERLDVAAADTVASSRERIKTPFAKIFVSDNPEKTYYHIMWWQDGQMQIGYGSASLTFVKRWLRDEFKIEAPAADVAPVVHGQWIDKPTGRYGQMQSWCSACGKHSGIGGIKSNRHKPYCPNCGAKMDGGTENAID